MTAYPNIMGSKQAFREDFLSMQGVSDNGGVATSVTVNNGATFNASTDRIIYGGERNLFNSAELTVKLTFNPDFDNDSGVVKYFYDCGINRNYILISGASGNMQVAFNDTQVANIASATVKAAWVTGAKNVLHISSTKGATSIWLNGTLILDAGATAWTPDLIGDWTVGNNAAPTAGFTGTLHGIEVFHSAWTAQEVADDIAGTTYSALDAKNSLIALSGRARYNDGSNEVTENLGSEGNLICGNGSTSSTFPTFNAPKEISFDGSDYLETDSVVSLLSTYSYLLHCRFKSTGVGFILDSRDGSNYGIACYIGGSNNLVVVSSGVAAQSITTSETYGDDVWRDLVVTWNRIDATSTQVSVYINGELVKTQALNVQASTSATIRVGNSKSNTPFNGSMQDVGLWKTTGTPRQARWLHQRGLKTLNI